MLLAIDIGNTHTVFGVWDGRSWVAVWRRATNPDRTEDQIAVWLKGAFDLAGVPYDVDAVVCGSVVPAANEAIERLAQRWFRIDPLFVQAANVGVPVDYEPPSSVGADRLVNALAALAKHQPPMVVVDLGTATTFDAISKDGVYVGGAILPGILVSSQALASHTAKLPQVEFVAPARTIGRNTAESIQSGLMFGYASAIDGIVRRIANELGGKALTIATGGLGGLFLGLCETIEVYEPNLTLDGLRLAYEKVTVRG